MELGRRQARPRATLRPGVVSVTRARTTSPACTTSSSGSCRRWRGLCPDVAEAARGQLLLLAARSLGVAARRPVRLPASARSSAARSSPNWSPPASSSLPRSTGGASRRSCTRRRRTASRRGPGAADTVRLADLVPRAHGAPVRLHLSHRDLHPNRNGVRVRAALRLDGHLVGRVDLKADRPAGLLRVQASWIEDDLDNLETAPLSPSNSPPSSPRWPVGSASTAVLRRRHGQSREGPARYA